MDQYYLVMFLREGSYIESNVDLLELDSSTISEVYLNHVGDYGYEDFYHLELVTPKSL